MIFRCEKSKLLYGVNTVLKAVPTRTTMTILECILIDTSSNEIKLTANDTELGIETLVEGTIEEHGIIALNAKIFSEIVRKLPDNEVTLSSDENYVTTIKCEKAKFNIQGKSGEEYTYLPEIEKKDTLSMTQFTLKELIRQTIFSVADDENNKIMTGELFEIKDNMLRIVGLDSHRVAIRNTELKNSYPDQKVIVPGKTLQEISKILPGTAEEMIDIYITDNHIMFEFENTTVVSRLIEGEYFRVDHMVSSSYETKIIIKKKELLSCIERATLLVSENDKKPIIMDIKDNIMELKIKSIIGSLKEEIEIQQEGKDLMIGFNPRYFIDALRVIDEEDIALYMVNPKAPCFIRDDENKYTYLILPVNFNAFN